jgi:hypothetical protein
MQRGHKQPSIFLVDCCCQLLNLVENHVHLALGFEENDCNLMILVLCIQCYGSRIAIFCMVMPSYICGLYM